MLAAGQFPLDVLNLLRQSISNRPQNPRERSYYWSSDPAATRRLGMKKIPIPENELKFKTKQIVLFLYDLSDKKM